MKQVIPIYSSEILRFLKKVVQAVEEHAGSSPVDDSVIARQSTFKQLASWGGFRRHFKAQDAEAAPDPSPAPADAALPVEDRLSHWWCKNLARRGVAPAQAGAHSEASHSPAALRAPWSP